MAVTEQAVNELLYHEYQERQWNELTPKQLTTRAEKVRKGQKFYHTGGEWKGYPYQGYAILSMIGEDPQNSKLNRRLLEGQIALANRLQSPQKYFFLPPESYHQTIANTLSGSRFKENITDKGLEKSYPEIIGNVLENIPSGLEKDPIDMKIIGLSIFSSSIGVLGVFEKAEDLNRILTFRDGIYENESLNQIGIKRTRPFIGHITLAYIEDKLTDQERTELVNACMIINQSIKRQDLHFYIRKAALRSYADLSYFHYESHYPVYSFVK